MGLLVVGAWDSGAGVDGGGPVQVEVLMSTLAGLRRATVGNRRMPHKPLLLLWLFARLAASGSSEVSYAEAEEPVSELINDYGPAVSSESAARQRAAMPFVHLERALWLPTDAAGVELPVSFPERRGALLEAGARGRLRPAVEVLLADPVVASAAVRLLLEEHFTPALSLMIAGGLGLDVDPVAGLGSLPGRVGPRRAGFAEEVRRAYAYRCAMCGFDGALGRHPVGLEAAHVRWHSQGGPDEVSNGVCLCELHHALFDLGVVGLTSDLRVTVSPLYVARTPAGRAVDGLAGVSLAAPRPGVPPVSPVFASWHSRQVFKSGALAA